MLFIKYIECPYQIITTTIQLIMANNSCEYEENDVIGSFIVEGKRYINSFPRSYFPIPIGGGHDCDNCNAYAKIGNILVGLCYNCSELLYPDKYVYAPRIKPTNLCSTYFVLPNYLTDEESEFIYQQYFDDIDSSDNDETEYYEEQFFKDLENDEES